MTKLCGCCGETKPVSAFNAKGAGFQSYCRSCQKIAKDKHYRANKVRYCATAAETRQRYARRWDEFKKDLECGVCGDTRIPVLDFHHRDSGQKLGGISSMVQAKVAWTRLMVEVAKCDVLCANCHRMLHHNLCSRRLDG